MLLFVHQLLMYYYKGAYSNYKNEDQIVNTFKISFLQCTFLTHIKVVTFHERILLIYLWT
jgi:hypothetical protein